MTKDDVIAKMKDLNLPKGSYVVFGSGPLAVAEIREVNDIDLYVTTELLTNLKKKGWNQIHKGPDGDDPIVYDIYEAHDHWGFSPYAPTLQNLLARSFEIDGITFASIQDVRRWKLESGGTKHLSDVAKIDAYYFSKLNDWEQLIKGVTPKQTSCGPVYEIKNLTGLSNESFAIADMRNLKVATPHYHKGREVEVYFVLQGSGITVVGGREEKIKQGSVIVTFPNTAHFTIPKRDLVLAVINTPPFNPENNIDLMETNKEVGFDKKQFDILTL